MILSRRTKLIAAGLLAVVLLREYGVMNVDWSRSSSSMTTSTSRSGTDAQRPKASLSDVTVWPSPFDYVPFFKTRTVRGEVRLPAGADDAHALVRCEFEVSYTVTGLCSARQFRDKIRQQVIKKINTPAKKK